MSRFLDALRLRVVFAPWSRLPAPLWFLFASPALRWALGPNPNPGPRGSRWFVWPLR